MPRIFEPKELHIMDDLTANNEMVLASLGGAPTMHEEKEEPDAMPEVTRYRSEEWGIERRYSETKRGVKRQRAGSRGPS
jgi:boron transporter